MNDHDYCAEDLVASGMDRRPRRIPMNPDHFIPGATFHYDYPGLTRAQEHALLVIDRYGASYLSNQTSGTANHVSARTAEALQRAGIVEIFHGADGRFAKRAGRETK